MGIFPKWGGKYKIIETTTQLFSGKQSISSFDDYEHVTRLFEEQKKI